LLGKIMKAVFFDMDGVLIDSEMFYMKGTYDWISKKGFNGELEDTFRLIGTNMEGTYNLLYEMLNKKYTISEIEEENRKYFLEHPIDYKAILNPFVKEILIFLKEHKIKIAVCSSSPKKTIEKALKECEILEYFDFIVSSDEVKKSKPNPDVYLKACEFLKVSKEDVFVIEDSTMGIEAGKNANIKVIAIKDKFFGQNQTKADYIFENLGKVFEFFKEEID